MNTEEPAIIRMEIGHLEDALALSREAKWNQLAADWICMMEMGQAIGVADPAGRLVASAICLPFGNQFSWVSMVLVTEDWQGHHLATRLLNRCLEILGERGLVPVVDATPAGEKVYGPLGFAGQFRFQRWEHPSVETIGAKSPGLGPADPTAVLKLDEQIFGGQRQPILENLLQRSSAFACMAPSGSGFALGRDGYNAAQIGPISAATDEDAIDMLDHALSHLEGPVFIDACDHQAKFTDRLELYGFKIQRPFLRMAYQRDQLFGQIDHMYAMAGPELG